MKKVSIVSSTAPAKPRSDKYPVGASVTRTSSGTTVVNQGGGESIDIVKKDDIKSFTDKNVLSSLRSVAEFISKKDDSQISAIVDFLKGLKIDGNLINRLLLQNTEAENVGDTDVMSALRVLAEIAANNEVLKNMFLRKDKVDSTDYLLRLFGGLEVGEAIDSLTAGKGIIADNKGRIQADRMELRSSLTVLEIIFNRLSAMESDYSFSESGTIESVELLEDGTYRLPLRKRWENDFTA